MPTTIYEDWQVGKVYTFNSVVPAILPITYKRLRLSSKSSYEDAKIMASTDIYSMWRQLYPHLPTNTPDTPSMSVWYIFRTEQGEIVALAEQWIDGATVVINEFTNFAVLVTDSNYTMMLKIRDTLNQMGVKFSLVDSNNTVITP